MRKKYNVNFSNWFLEEMWISFSQCFLQKEALWFFPFRNKVNIRKKKKINIMRELPFEEITCLHPLNCNNVMLLHSLSLWVAAVVDIENQALRAGSL